MATRLELQEKLETLLGSENVYFQPPEGFKLKYPCIVYSLDPVYTENADNKKYIVINRYHIKHIYKKLSGCLRNELLNSFMMISHDNTLIAEGMYNDDFTLYF